MLIEGLINLHKPLGLTSAQAVDRVRRITGQRKSGHAGSLDPIAEGVLLVCLGRATKLVERLMDLPKVYEATIRLDLTSPSFDNERDTTPVVVERAPDAAAVQAAVAALERQSEQVPPLHSALKVGGRPAYKLARRGTDVVLASRPVAIYWMHVRRFAWPELLLDVACGRGTYIRAIARDLGVALGTGGCLTHLRRSSVGPFQVEDAYTPARLAVTAPLSAAFRTIQEVDELLASVGVRAAPPRPAD